MTPVLDAVRLEELRKLAEAAKAVLDSGFRPEGNQYTQDGSETWEGDVSATLYHILYKGGVLDPETNQRALLPKASVRQERGR